MDHRETIITLYNAVLGRTPRDEVIAKHEQAFEAGKLTYEKLIHLVFAKKTKMGYAPLEFPPGHFYSPITDPALADAHLDTITRDTEVAGIDIDRGRMLAFWNELASMLDGQPFPDAKPDNDGYWFENPAYGYGDGTSLHLMMRHAKPKQIIEIGSGYSSLCMLDTRREHLSAETGVTFIEPYADLLKSLIGSRQEQNIRIEETFVQQVLLAEFEALEPNDILLIDSTHVLKTGSDVAFEIGEILPRLKPGVLVHVHDIFWPFEYKKNWAVKTNRSWNEVYALRYYLSENPNWEVVLFNDYLRCFGRKELEATAPWFLKNSGSSIWLKRIA